MEYTHKFSSGAVPMEKMLDEYHTLRKTRGYCKRCPNYGQYWSCPEYGFSETIFLNEFKYMILIGREYTIPKSDRQKIIGIKACGDYCTEVNNVMKVESWKSLLELEEKIPGTLTLMPGNCHICDLSGEGCARPKGQKCRHPELMRFSLESLGFDVDAICKFEIGLLLQWPREGHLPEKLSTVMAVLTNNKIPLDVIKRHFPDAKRSYLKAGETILGGEDKPKAKRLESWLDNQANELMQQEIESEDAKKQSWIGFKSEALDSGDYVKDRPWAEGDDEYPDPPAEAAPEMEAVSAEPPNPQREVSHPVFDPTDGPLVAPDEEDDSQFKWLGFKRSADEADEMMYARPIPKFSLSEEEKAAQEAAEQGADVHTPEESVGASSTTEQAQVEQALKDFQSEGVQTKAPGGAASGAMDKKAQIRDEFERALRAQMADMSEAEAEAFLAAKLGISIEPEEAVPAAPASPQPAYDLPDASPVPAAQAPVVPRPEPELEPEPIEFLDASSVKDVLGAALSIAQAVVADEPPAPEVVAPAEPEAPVPAPAAHPEPSPQPEDITPEEEDDSKYKWLGFKADLQEESESPEKGGWKKAY